MYKCDDEKFEKYVIEAYNKIPKYFLKKIDNVEIVIEDEPINNSKGFLLGLYTGVPLSKRNTAYGMYPITPDLILLFKKNIQKVVNSEDELKSKIFEVLYHEIGHYFGMNEEEIRESMRNYNLNKFE
jgi:predicted Zn-dependent protease with MMP-like domain